MIGNPVEHSKSPLIHAAFAAQTGQNISYTRRLAALDAFLVSTREFAAEGGRGMNVTIPFKEQAFRLAQEHGEAARLARAVNTLSRISGDTWRGDNTDGVGLIRDLCGNHGFALAGTRILLCGAGGAARGVVADLLRAAPAALVIANRTIARGHELVAMFEQLGAVTAIGYEELPEQAFDLVINATALGLSDRVPPLGETALHRGSWCYDMMYGNAPTAFQRWAIAHGAARALDGLGMLVEQAAESFFIWRGVRPDTAPVIAALRDGSLHATS